MRHHRVARTPGRHHYQELLEAGPRITEEDAARLSSYVPRPPRTSLAVHLAFRSSLTNSRQRKNQATQQSAFQRGVRWPDRLRVRVSGFRQVAGQVWAWARRRSAAMAGHWRGCWQKVRQVIDASTHALVPKRQRSADQQLEPGQTEAQEDRHTPTRGVTASHPVRAVFDRRRTR